MAGRLGSSRAPRPSSTSSNAGSTEVPPGAARPRISLTASTASTSASTASSSQAPAAIAARSSSPPRSQAVGDGRAPRSAVAQPSPSFSSRPPPPCPTDSPASSAYAASRSRAFFESLVGTTHVDHHVEVAALAGAAEMRDALASQPDLGVRLGPGLDLDLFAALDRRDADPRPEGGLGDRDRSVVVELGALPRQRRMRRDVDGDVQAARRTAPRPDLALVREADLVPLVDPGRDRDADRALAFRASVAVTRVARRLDDLALTAAARTGADVDHLAEHRLSGSSAPRREPLHCGQVIGSVPGLAPFPPHVSQRCRTVNSISFSVPLTASSKRDAQVVAQVGARPERSAPREPRPRRPATEEGVEDVREAAEPSNPAAPPAPPPSDDRPARTCRSATGARGSDRTW